MGQVFAAHDEQLDRKVASKLLDGEGSTAGGPMDGFECWTLGWPGKR